ncbi:MAG: hypothetical protein IJ613_09735 [Muribaculaceae bacterium]|nr:hypothetical protein [Muribaculaceae bacterium]
MNRYLLSILCLTALTASAQTDTTVVDRISRHSSERESLLQLAWQNPAIKQWQHGYSLSHVGLSWQLRHEDEPLVTQLGNHETTLAFDARTYIKHRSSTLWGRAYYNNGRQRGIRWNETSDLDVVYPYLLADSAATQAMKLERYSFMGGYADGRGRLAWGATIGYTAGLYYRNVDPRPRNVTARLDITAGVGWHLGHYIAAASVAFLKYKQTNHVTFYSELGSDKLFHLTGLTNDYGRFAGTGYNTYYKGNRWTASLNAHPVDGRGLSASVQASRFAFDNVLTSLNKLPLAHVTHNAIEAEAAWLASTWAVRATASASRRVGTENVFGDPAAQVYQQMGSHDNFHHNRFCAGVDAVWQHRWQRFALDLHPAISYNHVNVIYADPQGQWQLNDLDLTMRVKGGAELRRVFATLTLGVQWQHPIAHTLMLTGVKDEMNGLQRLIEHDYAYWSHGRIIWTTALAVHVAISDAYALRAGIDWQCGNYTQANRTHSLLTSLAFVF